MVIVPIIQQMIGELFCIASLIALNNHGHSSLRPRTLIRGSLMNAMFSTASLRSCNTSSVTSKLPVFAALASWLMLLGMRDAPSCANICARMILSSLGRDVRPLRGLALLSSVSRIYAPIGFVPASFSNSWRSSTLRRKENGVGFFVLVSWLIPL